MIKRGKTIKDAAWAALVALVAADALRRGDYAFAAAALVVAVALVWPLSVQPRPVRVALRYIVGVAPAVLLIGLGAQELIDPRTLHLAGSATRAIGAVFIGVAAVYVSAVARAMIRRRVQSNSGG